MEITGRVVKDAAVRAVKGDRKVVSFTVVVNDYYREKASGESKQLATYYSCSYWLNDKVAEKIRKGGIVELSGRTSVSVYKNMDGDAVASLNFHANGIKVHSGQPKIKEEKPKAAAVAEPADDLPF
ncbi:single-stranded DNA-binding protein [Parasediminibacterium sp. JCM 36343]|uniref:single-stranded DNA-binding protein n=1 Tax=Parasediminibacterium sp. JCM 36343 TaxID=3374279 RepID=UPI003978B240